MDGDIPVGLVAEGEALFGGYVYATSAIGCPIGIVLHGGSLLVLLVVDGYLKGLVGFGVYGILYVKLAIYVELELISGGVGYGFDVFSLVGDIDVTYKEVL